MASLKLTALNKVYPSGECALYNINLETTDKEFIIIVGGESSGKSSLLRIVAGLEDASSGEVYIDGKEVSDVTPKDRNIAMVFRGDTLYPALNVFENMAFGLKQRNAPKALIEQRVKAAANILGLNDVLYRKPKVLTAAVKQRVAIGRAIAREPKLYLFDEPLSGLDEKLRADMLNVIINLQARMQGTFVYATKNLSEAMTVATRLVVLKNGMLQQIDTPANLYDYPANAYVAFYIGSPTINFVKKVKILREDEGYVAAVGEIKLPLAENIVKRFEKIDEYVQSGNEVILGIRPEDAEAGAEGQIAAKCGAVESNGGHTYCECDVIKDVSLVVKGSENLSGTDVKVNIDLTRLYIFDAETRLTLLNRDAGYKQTDYADASFVPLSYKEEQAITEKLKPQNDKRKKK